MRTPYTPVPAMFNMVSQGVENDKILCSGGDHSGVGWSVRPSPDRTGKDGGGGAPQHQRPHQSDRRGVKTPSGLIYWGVRMGTGGVAKEGSRVRVHYTGWLINGKKFDSSVDAGTPADLRRGRAGVYRDE